MKKILETASQKFQKLKNKSRKPLGTSPEGSKQSNSRNNPPPSGGIKNPPPSGGINNDSDSEDSRDETSSSRALVGNQKSFPSEEIAEESELELPAATKI